MTSNASPKNRFLSVEQVADELNVGLPLVRTLLKAGNLRGVQIGARGIWRIARTDLEAYVSEAYKTTAARMKAGELFDSEA